MSRVIAYARVSTDKQDAENQRYEIERYLESNQVALSEFVEETVTGKADVSARKLGSLIEVLESGDTLIVSETSRISRRLIDVLGTIQLCIDRGITVIAVKEQYKFADDINSKVIAFAFGLAAEIERNLISQRTKEALARKKAEGVRLGRPPGPRQAHHYKLHKHEDAIRAMLAAHVSLSAIARYFNVNRTTVQRFVVDRKLRSNSHIQTGVYNMWQETAGKR